jgi:DNA adenine methylase
MAMTTKRDPWAHIPQPPGHAEAAAAVAAQRHEPTTKATPRRTTASRSSAARSSASRSRQTETGCAQRQMLLFDDDITDSQSGGAVRWDARPSPERPQSDDETMTATRQFDLFGGVAFHDLLPVLKWAGGKRWLVETLRAMWARHAHRRLVEPFCGGAAVTLGLRPARALLNDVSPHLINLYTWIPRGLRINLRMENDEALYYENRDRFNELLRARDGASADAASLFYYLNRTCFNGLCRFNSRGEFNVPFGRFTRINYRTSFAEHADAFAAWQFSAGDFETVALDPDDFVYADPPYDATFAQYAAEGFDWNDQVRAATWLAAHPGPVVASNVATDQIVDLYRGLGFDIGYVTAPRRISADGDRTPVREMLATKHL